MTFNRAVMRWQQIAEHWATFRGSLHERWGRLSEVDLELIDGRRERLLRVLQERYGLRGEEAEALLLEWQKDVAEDTPTLVFWNPQPSLANRH
jgi:uncharacterized protein YjbJ (UPF0337 family)